MNHLRLVCLLSLSFLLFSLNARARTPADLQFIPADANIVCQVDIERASKAQVFKELFKSVLADDKTRQFVELLRSELGLSLPADLKRVTFGSSIGRDGPKNTIGVFDTKVPASRIFEKIQTAAKSGQKACMEAGGTPKTCTQLKRRKKRGRVVLEMGETGLTLLEERLLFGSPTKALYSNKALGRRTARKSKSVLKSRQFKNPLKEVSSEDTAWCVGRFSKAMRAMMKEKGQTDLRGLKHALFGVDTRAGLKVKLLFVSTAETARRLKSKTDGQWKQLFKSPMVRLMGLAAFESALKTTANKARFELVIDLDEAQASRLQAVMTAMLQRQRANQPGVRRPPTSISPPPGGKIRTTP